MTLEHLLLLRCSHPLKLPSADLDFAGLRRLRHLLDQVDMEHAVEQAGANDFDVVGLVTSPFSPARAGDIASRDRNSGEVKGPSARWALSA